MKHTNQLLYYSLLAAFLPSVAMGGIRVGNASRNNAQGYQQVNEMRYGAADANQAAMMAQAANAELPIPVSDSKISDSIKNGDANAESNMARLEQCAMIYPDGEFEWARPTLGRGAGGAIGCTAVVEMRAVGAAKDGGDAILARGNLAVGDIVECNISNFPESSHLTAAGEIEFPADRAPTMDDVVKAMNQEQKQNAGIKIAAGAILGGLGGNVAGAPEPGSDNLLGGGKAKTQSTIVGALGGAALMAGNAYTGKVAGDTILSAGVNAAAGAVVGNVVAAGDSVLRIMPCTVDGQDKKCLWGYWEETESLPDGAVAYVSAKSPSNFKVCDQEDGKETCEFAELDIDAATIPGYTHEKVVTDKDGTESKQQVFTQTNRATGDKIDIETIFRQDQFQHATDKTCYKNGKMESGWTSCQDPWVKLSGTVYKVTSSTPAMVVDVEDKTFGWKKEEWSDFLKKYSNAEVVGRSGAGIATNLAAGKKTLADDGFRPAYQDSEDGGIVDISNKARLKGTLTGAGVGGGMGAFSGYQGAQKDIEDRWLLAQEEYRGRLSKIYCATGNRFLSTYNSVIEIVEPEN